MSFQILPKRPGALECQSGNGNSFLVSGKDGGGIKGKKASYTFTTIYSRSAVAHTGTVVENPVRCVLRNPQLN